MKQVFQDISRDMEQTPVIGENKFGYQSGTVKDLPGLFPILLGGDVNGDNVIDMKDLTDEINVYYQYKNLNNIDNPDNKLANKTAFLNSNRNADIYWIKPSGLPVTELITMISISSSKTLVNKIKMRWMLV